MTYQVNAAGLTAFKLRACLSVCSDPFTLTGGMFRFFRCKPAYQTYTLRETNGVLFMQGSLTFLSTVADVVLSEYILLHTFAGNIGALFAAHAHVTRYVGHWEVGTAMPRAVHHLTELLHILSRSLSRLVESRHRELGGIGMSPPINDQPHVQGQAHSGHY
jgi:hypothetical protein